MTVKKDAGMNASRSIDEDKLANSAVERAEREAEKTTAFTKRNKRLRITQKTRDAIWYIVSQGLSVKEAAKAAGITHQSLFRNLKKDHVIAYKRGIIQASAQEWGTRSIALTAAMMSDKSTAPATRLQAQQEMRRICGLYGKVHVGDQAQSTKLVIEIKQSSDDDALEVSSDGTIVRAKDPKPILQ